MFSWVILVGMSEFWQTFDKDVYFCENLSFASVSK